MQSTCLSYSLCGPCDAYAILGGILHTAVSFLSAYASIACFHCPQRLLPLQALNPLHLAAQLGQRRRV